MATTLQQVQSVFNARRVERDVGFHTSLDAPNQFSELWLLFPAQFNHPSSFEGTISLTENSHSISESAANDKWATTIGATWRSFADAIAQSAYALSPKMRSGFRRQLPPRTWMPPSLCPSRSYRYCNALIRLPNVSRMMS